MLHSKFYIISFVFCLSLSLHTSAQVNSSKVKNKELRAAIVLYNDMDFSLAAEKIELYRIKEAGSYDDTLALRLLADCYWKLRNYKKAKFFYENLLSSTKYLSPISKLHLAQLNAMNGNYDIASRFLIGMNEEKNILQGFQNTRQYYEDSLDYNVHLLDNNNNVLNKKNITPVIFGDSLFWTMEGSVLPVLTMSNLKDLKNNKKRRSKTKKNILRDEDPTTSVFNPSTVSYLPTSRKVYFTIKNDVEDSRHLRIAEADIKGSPLSELFTFSLGLGEYTMINPVISPDGSVLIFLSNKNADQFDIYYCLKKESTWSRPFPLSVINTSGDELFPTFDASGTFYFNSNGRAGLGGLDVYKVKLKILGGDDVVHHLPYPINTPNDDFHFTTTDDGDKGYFISDRQGKDDFYFYDFKTKYIKVSGQLKFNGTNKAITDRSVLIYEKSQFAEGNWTLKDSIKTDDEGSYQFKGRPNTMYKEIINDGLENFEMFFETHDNLQPLVLETILLEDRNKPKPPVVTNIDSVLNKFIVNYEFGKATLSNESKVVLDSLVKYLKENPTFYGIAASFTDCSGKAAYNLKLSAMRSKEMLAYLITKGIPASRIKESHFGNEFLINPCSELNYKSSTQSVNRRTEVYVSRSATKSWQQINSDTTVNILPITSTNINYPVTKVNSLPKEEKTTNPSKIIPAVKLIDPEVKLASKVTEPLVAVIPPVVVATAPEPGVRIVEKEKPTADFYKNPTVAPKTATKYKTTPINVKNQRVYTYTEKSSDELPTKDDANKSAVRSFLDKQYANANEEKPHDVKPAVLIPKSSLSKNEGSPKIMNTLTKSMTVINDEQERIQEYLTKRENKKSIMVSTFSDSVFIEIYDNGIYDHDTISVIFNNQLVVDRKEIGTNVKEPIRFSIKLNDDVLKNQMVIIAENLGTEPPNSALLVIHDKLNNQKKIYLTTDLLHNEVVYFINLSKE